MLMSAIMLCEKCHEREALVHVLRQEGGQPPSDDGFPGFNHHFCETCAKTDPIANPRLRYGPDAIEEKFRIIGVSENQIRVRLVRTESEAVPTDWILLRDRIPSEYAEVGKEFGILCTRQELEYLKGNRETLGKREV